MSPAPYREARPRPPAAGGLSSRRKKGRSQARPQGPSEAIRGRLMAYQAACPCQDLLPYPMYRTRTRRGFGVSIRATRSRRGSAKSKFPGRMTPPALRPDRPTGRALQAPFPNRLQMLPPLRTWNRDHRGRPPALPAYAAQQDPCVPSEYCASHCDAGRRLHTLRITTTPRSQPRRPLSRVRDV